MARLRARHHGRGRRVVVIDDDIDLLESTENLLRGEGHDVRGGSSADAGVELVRDFKPDLVLLDFYLGDGLGSDVVRRVREFDRLVQVLLVTGYASEQPARKLLAELDIQGYHDKSDGAERLLVWVDASLKHYELLARMERQQSYLRSILDSSPRITALQPTVDLLAAALQGLSDLLLGGDGVVATENNGLFVLDDATAGVSLHAGTGRFADTRGFNTLPDDVASAIRAGFELEGPRFHPLGYVLVPLRTRAGARGCMAVQAGGLDAEAIDPAEIFGRQVVQALENVVLYERATVDPLTRLYHRAFGEQRLEETLKLASRLTTPTSVLMIDIDHFKRLNDTYGHAAGDLGLRAVARVIKSSCRATDIVARYGGEEILVVLPATDAEGAHLLAERIRRRVADFALPFEGQRLSCTVSIGAATDAATAATADRPVARDVEGLMRCADRALYRAKESGRNRTCVDGDD